MTSLETVYAAIILTTTAALVIGNAYAVYKHGPTVYLDALNTNKNSTPEERILDDEFDKP